MIFGCAYTLSYLSKHMTLRPGDLIFMGTPEGVIWGRPEGERHWLESGDKVEVVEPLAMMAWGSFKFVIRDPDGHLLAFVQGEGLDE